MNGLPYYKAYPRDFIEGTIGMPFELKAAYRLVLDLIYLQGGRLPDDPRYISGLLGCSVRAWNKFREQLIATGKIHTENGIISNFRADKELETLRTLQEVKRENRTGANKNNDLEKRPSDDTEPDTESKKKREPNGSPKRAVRLPSDWTLPSDWRRDALDAGLSENVIDLEAAKILDWSRSSKNGAKLDWRATWRNWCRNATPNQPRGSPSKPVSASQPDPNLVTLAQDDPDFLAVKRKRRAEEGRDVIVSATGKATISRAEVEQARKWVQEHDQGTQSQELAHAGSHH